MDRFDHKDPAGKPEFDLQGRLGNFLISDILQMIGFSGKTGTLTLIQGWNSRTISFDQGRICYVAAGARLPGKSEEEMLAELVQRRLLDREDLDRCHELLLESAVYTLFLWRNCVYTFKSGEVVKDGGVAVTVDGNHLIIEGTRRVDEWIQISPVVPSIFMIFRQRPHLIERTIPEGLERVYQYVDGQRDVATIARVTSLTQFDAAKALYDLVQARFVEAIPPNKRKVCELYNLAVESIYLKLVLFDYSRHALMFENELNRFAVENRLKVRMAAGKIIRSDLETPIGPTELVDLYKLFIGIQNNKFSKSFEPHVYQGLMEGLYLNSDPEFKAMMRMYEFIEIEGLLLLDMFEGRRPRREGSTTDELAPAGVIPRGA